MTAKQLQEQNDFLKRTVERLEAQNTSLQQKLDKQELAMEKMNANLEALSTQLLGNKSGLDSNAVNVKKQIQKLNGTGTAPAGGTGPGWPAP